MTHAPTPRPDTASCLTGRLSCLRARAGGVDSGDRTGEELATATRHRPTGASVCGLSWARGRGSECVQGGKLQHLNI